MRDLLEERLALMAPARRLRLALADVQLRKGVETPSATVIDAGAADGLLTLALAKRHPGWRFYGLDLREDMLAGARQRAAGRGLRNVEFAQADLTRPLPAGGADAVLALECLSEIPEDREAVRMMAAALAPGGLLVVQVPERDWKPVLRGSSATWREQVRHGYSADELSSMLEAAGLVCLEVRPRYRNTAALAQEIRDRIKDSGLVLRALAFPALAACVWLERLGLTWGPPRALLAVARRRVER